MPKPISMTAKTAVWVLLLTLTCIVASEKECAEGQTSGQSPRITAPPEAPTVPRSITIGTFNIRMFPCGTDCRCIRSHGFNRCEGRGRKTNLRRLAEEIERLDVQVLAVNEILEPQRFERFATERLGVGFRFVWASSGGPHKVGFLYDTAVVELESRRAFDQFFTNIKPNRQPGHCVRRRNKLRPAFACRFRVAGTSFDFYAIAVHLKSGPCGSVRRDQWAAMNRIVRRLQRTDPDIIILGDFNDFKPQDDVKVFQSRSGFKLLSGDLPCTVTGWKTPRLLDHILVSPRVAQSYREGSIRVGGPCLRKCVWKGKGPAYSKRVSDHCPVTAAFRTNTRE